jgi:UDP-galactopyranose mutase
MKNEQNADHLMNKKEAYKQALDNGINKSSGNSITDSGYKVGEGSDTRGQEKYQQIIKRGLEGIDLVCFSHLRWNFVFQRPQHLLTRFAKKQRVFFIEEPVFENIGKSFLAENTCFNGIHIHVPHIPHGLSEDEVNQQIKNLVDELFHTRAINDFISWYYTPMALPFSRHLKPKVVVYDCMDELSLFKGAPPKLISFEQELFKLADVVFTGGMNLYEFKKDKHHNIHGVPSSIDREHFSSCADSSEPEDQKNIPHPRIGFYGVLDERLNIELVSGLAKALPDWNIIMIGPVVKIDPATLPKQSNIHYLGGKDYKVLPCYLKGWDVAMLPFALNESTRFISPTKTPEYLAAGKPVVSTSITDVVKPYGELGIVHIADTAQEFAVKVKLAHSQKDDQNWNYKVDMFLSQNSWDKTYQRMHDIISKSLLNKNNGDDIISESAELALDVEEDSLKQDLIKSDEQRSLMNMIERMGREQWDRTWGQIKNMFGTAFRDKRTSFGEEVEKNISSQANASGTLIFDYLIVGAGFAGSVLAERLAVDGNKKVLIIDKRDHIGGNAYDHYNEDGILVHKYGPHIFHTNSKEVFDYLSQFTKWRNYEHRVLASVDGMLLPIPINLDTINQLYGFNFNAFELENYFASVAESKSQIITSEDVVVGKVGRDLYEKFFKGYTRKQWGLDPSELNASVTARVPTRTNRDDRYFTDTYQAMPMNGYTPMFSKMLNHPNIKIMLNTDYKEIMNLIPYKEMIYTGPIDEFFNYKYGKLPYRSLEFVFETLDTPVFQKVGTINYPNEHKFTRITEFKYLSGQQHNKTTIVYEFPQTEGDPYYPVPQKENFDLYSKYEKLAKETRPDVHFVGRLATYKYYNMDQVVAQALGVYKKIKKNWEVQGEYQHETRSRQKTIR